ncbi:MAG: SapC family protein [Pseudomonadota bacterium]
MDLKLETTGLYEKPMLIQPSQHGQLRLKQQTTFQFAQHLPAVPLVAQEFMDAAGSLPIIFSRSGEQFLPQAVLGVTPGRNLFVDTSGQWQAGAYVPAYVRRYPFVFLEHDEQYLLCIEQGAVEEESDDNEQLQRLGDQQVLDRALGFCNAYQQQWQATEEFCQVLSDMQLLEEKRIRVDKKGTESRFLTGLYSVELDKLNSLTPKKFSTLRDRGWLPAVYAQLHSWTKFQDLLIRAG